MYIVIVVVVAVAVVVVQQKDLSRILRGYNCCCVVAVLNSE